MTSSRLPILTNLTLTLAVAASLATLASCAGQGDVDRSQPDKVSKSIFFDAQSPISSFSSHPSDSFRASPGVEPLRLPRNASMSRTFIFL